MQFINVVGFHFKINNPSTVFLNIVEFCSIDCNNAKIVFSCCLTLFEKKSIESIATLKLKL